MTGPGLLGWQKAKKYGIQLSWKRSYKDLACEDMIGAGKDMGAQKGVSPGMINNNELDLFKAVS